MAGAGDVESDGLGPLLRRTVGCGAIFWVGATWMRAVSFFGAALMEIGLASAAGAALGAVAGAAGGRPGLSALGGGTAGRVPRPGSEGAAGGRGGGAGGGTRGRVAAGGGGGGAEEEGNGVAPPRFVVSFFGAAPGALMRTVSRFTKGVSSGFGGRVMRTVSFFGVERFSAAGLFEGSSSAIFVRGRISISPAFAAVKHLRAHIASIMRYSPGVGPQPV
jgi:hypothetical protein